jgi:hypothetical protein
MLPTLTKPRGARRAGAHPPHRPLAAACLALLALLLLVDMYNWGLLVPHFTYHAYRRRWVRVHTARDWRRVAAAKATLPRYRPPANQSAASPPFPFPVKVLSLPRSSARRRSAQEQLATAGVPFEFVDAVDGDDPAALPAADVERYFSGERLAKFRGGSPNARFKVACDLSHFRLMHALLASPLQAQLVLEDDFQLPAALAATSRPGRRRMGQVYQATRSLTAEGDEAAAATAESASPFLGALNATLHALPADWDVLHLSLCEATLGGEVGPGVRVFSRGFCTLGLLYSRRAALAVLREAEVGSRNVDNLLMDLTEASAARAAFECICICMRSVLCHQLA